MCRLLRFKPDAAVSSATGESASDDGYHPVIAPPHSNRGALAGPRVSYSAFRAAFISAWLIVGAGLICVAARIHAGFVLFVCAGVVFAFLGAGLALDSGELSDRMVDEVVSRSGSPGKPQSVTRFGGALLLVIGAGTLILGVVALSQ